MSFRRDTLQKSDFYPRTVANKVGIFEFFQTHSSFNCGLIVTVICLEEIIQQPEDYFIFYLMIYLVPLPAQLFTFIYIYNSLKIVGKLL